MENNNHKYFNFYFPKCENCDFIPRITLYNNDNGDVMVNLRCNCRDEAVKNEYYYNSSSLEKNIPLKEYVEDIKRNECNIKCDKIKNNGDHNDYSEKYCFNCKEALCEKCLKKHDTSHELIPISYYKNQNYCTQHNHKFNRFCNVVNCKRNLCMNCTDARHSTFYYGDILPFELKNFNVQINKDKVLKDLIKIKEQLKIIKIYFNNIEDCELNDLYGKFLQRTNGVLFLIEMILETVSNDYSSYFEIYTINNINKITLKDFDEKNNSMEYLKSYIKNTNISIQKNELIAIYDVDDISEETILIGEKCYSHYLKNEDFYIDGIKMPFKEEIKFNKCGKHTMKIVSKKSLVDMTAFFGFVFQLYEGNEYRGAQYLIEVDMENWNTSNTINMGCMFCSLQKLKIVKASNWNTANVENMNSMFSNCVNLEKFDYSKWLITPNSIFMFSGCKKYNKFK